MRSERQKGQQSGLLDANTRKLAVVVDARMMKGIVAILGCLLARIAFASTMNEVRVVPHSDICNMTPVDRGDRIYIQMQVVTPVGNWPEERSKDVVDTRPQLQLTFPTGFKRVTFGAGLWSSTNTTILIRLVASDKAQRAELIEQWRAANIERVRTSP